MEWIESAELPAECQACTEGDCYNCDYAGKRWTLSQKDELRIKALGIKQAITRLQRQLAEIEQQLQCFPE